jgi:DNA-binding response OmpR family regulator
MAKSIHEFAPVPNVKHVEYICTLEDNHTLSIPDTSARILIVENHPAIADMLCWTLELSGYRCDVVERVEALFESVLQFSDTLALMLLDLSVSLADAQSFIEALSERWNSTIPVIILTTNKELQAALPEYRVFLKPFHIHDLLNAIQQILVA